jgi:hypothetical protein
VRPDAVSESHVVLVKLCRTLRLTQQIRLATFMAHSQSKQLLLAVRSTCVFSPDLEAFIAETGLVEVRRG